MLTLLAVIVVAGVAARLALPSYLERYVNRVLDQSPRYDGRVGEIDVHLWRGAYSIHDIDIVKTSYSVPVPFFESERVDVSLDWGALFGGSLRGKITMEQPKLNFVHGPTEDESQTGANEPWLDIMNDLSPFRIDKTEINDGEIHFRAFHTDPKVDIYLSDVEAVVTNLTNVTDDIDPLMAHVSAHGRAMNRADEELASATVEDDVEGRFEFEMDLDPNAHHPTFDLSAKLLDLDVTKLNALTKAYGRFDFQGGSADFVLQLDAKNGLVEGYAKPLFRDLQVITWEDVETDDPLSLFWEALVGVAQEVFQNQPRNQFGTRLTLEGDVFNPQTDLFEIVGNVLRNAFVRAFLPEYDQPAEPNVGEGGVHISSGRSE